MIRLLLEQGLPYTTVKHLDDTRWDVRHVSDIRLSRASDREILNAARNDSRTIVTPDADFHAMLALEGVSSPSVIRNFFRSRIEHGVVMLVTFTTSAYAGITPFGDVALHLLKLMGHSAKPGSENNIS